MNHYMHTAFRVRLLLPFLFSFWHPASGATKYVSMTGNNNNTGNSWAQAWLTMQYAEDHINAGDTVWVADGSYTGFDVRVTGTQADPIVFIAAGDNVVINLPCPTTDGINVENTDHIEINGFRVIDQPRNGIRLVNADWCIVRNNYCSDNFERGIFTGFTGDILIEYNECLTSIDEHGIYVSNSSDRSIIRYNICHHNNRGGIQINADESQGGDGISSDPRIYGNILYENGTAGGAAINLDGVEGAFIYNNLLYENHASGIALFQQDGAGPSINATIVHNTVVNASDARWCILIVNGSTGASIQNNIIINQHPWRGSIALSADALTDFASDYNILVNSMSANGDGSSVPFSTWQSYGYDAHSMLAEPLSDLFLMPGSDYHLIEGAQAINAGSAAHASGVTDDIENIPRPQGIQHDIGAYEFAEPLSIDESDPKNELWKNEWQDFTFESERISWKGGIEGLLGIYRIDGRIIHQVNISQPGEMNLGFLPEGLYLAVMRDPHGVQWSKWIGIWNK